jgi:hypothetical protein
MLEPEEVRLLQVSNEGWQPTASFPLRLRLIGPWQEKQAEGSLRAELPLGPNPNQKEVNPNG